ncbi:MAG: hypothetical protein M3P12_00160 [Gemmatimonadota bacterium]|nr:hypothetical protein [Gemmatimonadota bacterium]
MTYRIRTLWILLCGLTSELAAQTPPPTVTTSFGVDTTIREVRDIVRLTRAYLAQPDASARSRGLWSQSPVDARYGDLAMEAYQGLPATIIGVTGAAPGDSVFAVKIIYGSADTTGTSLHPIALQRLYAVRAPGSAYGWQFSSPLPRLTRAWPHRSFGRITYWYAPGITPSSAKGLHASRFVDSVAMLFSVKPPSHLDAYLTPTMDEGLRLMGLDFSLESSGPGTGLGGRGGGAGDYLILSDPRVGEAYLHELVHSVLNPTLQSRNPIFNEGVASWLGGSGILSPRELYTGLDAYQRSHTSASMLDVLQGRAEGPDARAAFYGTRALIVDSIYRSSGIPGLKRFAQVTGAPANLIATLPNYIAGIGADPNLWWRSATAAAVKRIAAVGN